MRIRLFAIIFCLWYGHSALIAQSFSTLSSTELPVLGNVQVEWADFNNDGYQDAIVNGIDNDGFKHFEIYQNDQDNTFTLVGLPVVALKNATFLLADFNNDNKVDILYGGRDDANQVKNHLLLNQGTSFTVSNDLLSGFYQAKLLDFDINLDGQQDVIICGYNNAGAIETSVWIQNSLSFTQSTDYSLPDLLGASLAKADLNQDGILDLFISGESQSGQFISKLLLLDKDAELTEKVFSATSNLLINDVQLVDYTADGLTDIFLIGRNSSFSPVLKLYKSQSGTYSEISSSIPVLNNASFDLKDLDNDGDKDLVIIGLDGSSNYRGEVFTNDGTGNFTDANITMDGISNGSIQIVDIDKDGKNDFFATGFSDTNPTDPIISYFYRNTIAATNGRPNPPTGLSNNVNLNAVELGWTKSTDALTATNELTYQIAVGTSSGNYNVVSELSISGGNDLLVNTIISNGTAASSFLSQLSEGEYFWTVQAIDAGGLSSGFAAEQSFIICDKPDLGTDSEICVGDDALLSAGVSADEVNWYSKTDGLLLSDNNDFSYTVEKDDTIIVEVIKPLGCTVYDTVNIKAIELPASSLPSNISRCESEMLTLNISESFDNIDWFRKGEGLIQSGGTSYSQVVSTNDTIIAELTNGFGCVGYDTVFVQSLVLPDQNPLVTVELCEFDTLSYSINTAYDQISWYTKKLGVIAIDVIDIKQAFTESDTLFVDKTNVEGCLVTDTIVVTVNPLPEIDLGSDVSICENSSAQFEITGTWSSVEWSSAKRGSLASDLNVIDFTVTEDDSLFVEVVDDKGCSNADTLLITKLDLPVFSLGNDTAICVNANILLEAQEGLASVEWTSVKNGLLESGDWFLDYQATEADTIIAKAFAFNGCTYTDSIIVDTIEPPFYDLGDDFSICSGEIVNIEIPTLSDSINWYLGDSLLNTHQSNINFEADNSVTVYAEYINNSNCIGYDTLQVTVNKLPTVDLGEDFSICFEDNFELSVEGAFSKINWYSESEGLLATDQPTLNRTAVNSEKIYVEFTNLNGCFASDTVNVTVNQLPDFDLGNDIELCEGESAVLTVDIAFDSINWYNDKGDEFLNAESSFEIIPAENEKWFAEVWNASGCVNTDSINLIVNPLPVFDAGEELFICNGGEVNLNPVGIDNEWTLSWSPNANISDVTIANPIVSPDSDTWYILTATTSAGCSYADSVLVSIDAALVVNAGEDKTICPNGDVQIGGAPTASGSAFEYTYQWSPATTLSDANAANPVAFPGETTTYQVIVQAGDCKRDTAEVTVFVKEEIVVEIPMDTTIGAGDEIQLFARGGDFYRWEPATGLTDPTIADPIASPQSTTTYTLTATDSLGCFVEKQMTIFVKNQVFIPNLFTPNNDGENDHVKLYGAGFESIRFEVRDRQGRVMYSTDNPREALEIGWDGMVNGANAEEGIYVWYLSGRFYDGTAVQFNGNNSGIINLLR